MNTGTSRWQQLLSRFRKREPRTLIMLGIDYGCHQWHGALTAGNQFRISTFIDDEPWNHRTYIGAAQVRYPSELLALVHKHRACAVTEVAATTRPALDDATLRELRRLRVPLLSLPAHLPPDPAGTLTRMLAPDS
jgi:hypothetical protein